MPSNLATSCPAAAIRGFANLRDLATATPGWQREKPAGKPAFSPPASNQMPDDPPSIRSVVLYGREQIKKARIAPGLYMDRDFAGSR
jgi:hypothetical protein